MSVSIIACPSCKALVLPDTAQCPNCQYVFDEKRAAREAPAPPPVESAEEEVPCPGCNELVRKGLVRCWNCGTFMREEIAETYRRMQISPPRVIYSELPEEKPDGNAFSGSMTDSGRLIDTRAPAAASADAEDGDFEVSSGMDDSLGDGFDFDVGTAQPPSLPNEIVESAPVYALRSETPPPESPKEKPAPSAKTAGKKEEKKKADPRQEFSNEFENRFGIDDVASATGDGLLRVALAEEAEGGRRRLKHGDPGGRSGFRVYCPNGHRIEVQERHRGLTGRCPRCREPFVVPAGTWDEEKAQQDDDLQKAVSAAAAAGAGPAEKHGELNTVEISAGEYTRWMIDSNFHVVDLNKLKLKPASLLKDFQEADVGFSPDGVLIVTLVKKGGLLGGGEKKKLATREAVLDHLSHGKPREQVPGADRRFYAADLIGQLRIVQPIESAEHSMFAGVPVFGDGRIAVRLPKRDDASPPEFLSFTLSQFRRFAKILEEFFGLKSFGQESGIPLDDVVTERYCHFTDAPLRILENLEFYRNDPALKLVVIGRMCAGCGLVVSEESREKQNIGGKGAKKIAKAKCPKCQKPFGDLPLYALDAATGSESPA